VRIGSVTLAERLREAQCLLGDAAPSGGVRHQHVGLEHGDPVGPLVGDRPSITPS
jgi:hypothetical protein